MSDLKDLKGDNTYLVIYYPSYWLHDLLAFGALRSTESTRGKT